MSAPVVTRPRRQEGPRTVASWPVVARREVMAHLTDRNFIIGTVMTLLLFGVVFGVQAFMEGRSHHYDVAVTTPQGTALVQQVDRDPAVQADKVGLTAHRVDSVQAAKQQVQDGSVDAMLTREGGQWVLTGDRSVNDTLHKAVSTVVSTDAMSALATRAGTTTAAVQHSTEVPFKLLNTDAKNAQTASIASFIFAFLFYMSSLMFGMNIANSVVQEKQSRIVEIIASAIPVNQLLLGKVIGMIALAMMQMMLFVGVGLAGVAFTEYSQMMPSLTGGAMWFILFFLVGFAALASLWAVAGALASRTEDISQTSMPLTMTLVLIFIVVLRLEGAGLRIASFIPVVSSLAMPRRVLEGGLPLWEPLLALVITIVAALGIVRFAAMVYRRALMQTGGRLTIRQALKAER